MGDQISGVGRVENKYKSPIERIKLALKERSFGALSFNGDPNSVKVDNMFTNYFSDGFNNKASYNK